jgi:hypothetical protein
VQEAAVVLGMAADLVAAAAAVVVVVAVWVG